jgi:hypothetical protein
MNIIFVFEDVVRIVSASLNYCRGAIFTNANSPYHQKLANIMRTRQMDRNILQHDIETGLISSRSRWKKIAYTDDFEFPELSFDDLCRGGPRHRTLGRCKIFLGEEKNFWGGVKIFLGEHKNFF